MQIFRPIFPARIMMRPMVPMAGPAGEGHRFPTSFQRALSAREIDETSIQILASRIFRQSLDPGDASFELSLVPITRFSFFGLTLRTLDDGQKRRGSIREVITFCQRQEETFPVEQLKQDPNLQGRFFDLLGNTFPGVI